MSLFLTPSGQPVLPDRERSGGNRTGDGSVATLGPSWRPSEDRLNLLQSTLADGRHASLLSVLHLSLSGRSGGEE